MTQLSRMATLAIGKETTPGTYAPPTLAIPFQTASFEDTIAPLQDTSYRGNDTNLQGEYAGVMDSTWDVELNGYVDLAGVWLRGVIGPDTVTAGVSTTLAAATTVGATSIQTAAAIAAGAVLMLDTGTTVEYCQATAASTGSSSPYTTPVTTVATQAGPSVGLTKPHASGVAVAGQTIHTFAQDPTVALPTYSLTVWDTTQWLTYSYARISEVDIKIDPKAAVTFDVKFMNFPGVVGSAPTSNAYTQAQPWLGWQWSMFNAGATSTRGLTLDYTIKRAAESVHSSDAIQRPREIFVGVLDIDGTYKAIFENQTDLNLFQNYQQTPTTATLTQPVSYGGTSLAITTNKSAYTTGKRDLGQTYVQADYAFAGIYNSTDGGAVTATLANWTTTAY